MKDINFVIVGAGTAGLVAGLITRVKYPFASIKIIKSSEIGIIGVGEGSTEHWDTFMRFTGLNHIDLISKTDATVKIGILFKDWVLGKEYVHSVGDTRMSFLNTPEIFNNKFLYNKSKFPLSPEFEYVYYKGDVTLTPNLHPSNQYHFDTFKLNSYLTEVCISRNIEIVEGTVKDVVVSENHLVKKIVLEDGTEHKATLYYDCSGFKRVLSSKQGNKWVSYKKYLPLNHSIAFPLEFDTPDKIEPYTTSTALKHGWAWKIPTQNRYGNGYVFSDNYTTADKALDEISKHLNKNIEKVARDIKFEAGKVEKFWLGNVINLGLSGSFVEPLEAQSIGFTIIQAANALNYIDLWGYTPVASEKYNLLMNETYENIVDYIQLHYLTDRADSEFWNDKPYELTSFNSTFLDTIKHGEINPSLFNNDSSHLMFRTLNWYQVAAGINLIDYDSVRSILNRNSEFFNANQSALARDIVDRAKNILVMNHRDFLNLVRYNYKSKNEN
jgi:hypothetical protein